jgi:hypothetical protein
MLNNGPAGLAIAAAGLTVALVLLLGRRRQRIRAAWQQAPQSAWSAPRLAAQACGPGPSAHQSAREVTAAATPPNVVYHPGHTSPGCSTFLS